MTEDISSPTPLRSYMPSHSTIIGALGGGVLGSVIVWLLGVTIKAHVPAELAASLGAVIGSVVGYFFEGGRKTKN